MRIGILGAGKAGVVTGTCLADMGHSVIVTDRNQDKLDDLNSSESPFYERGLRDLISRNTEEGRLVFTANRAQAIENKHIVFIAVDTPTNEAGVTDLGQVFTAVEQTARQMAPDTVIAIKSTMPIGTMALIKKHCTIRRSITWH